jgi:hypothetical protein
MPRNRNCSNREYNTSDSESESCQCKRCEKEKHRKSTKKQEQYKCHSCNSKVREIKWNNHSCKHNHSHRHNHNNTCCNNDDVDYCKKECKKDCQDGKVILITIS